MHEKEHGHIAFLRPEICLITVLIMITLTVYEPDDSPVCACCPNKVQGSYQLANIFMWVFLSENTRLDSGLALPARSFIID